MNTRDYRETLDFTWSLTAMRIYHVGYIKLSENQIVRRYRTYMLMFRTQRELIHCCPTLFILFTLFIVGGMHFHYTHAVNMNFDSTSEFNFSEIPFNVFDATVIKKRRLYLLIMETNS